MKKNRNEICSSLLGYLLAQTLSKGLSKELVINDDNIWCSLVAMSTLFDCTNEEILLHLKYIFKSQELLEDKVNAYFLSEVADGVECIKQFYSLDAVIAVGYRVDSISAIQFRQEVTKVLKGFAVRGYILYTRRMENGTFLNKDYFEHLLAEISEIRLSKRNVYQKFADIYATSIDYNKDAPTTKLFYKMVQNKMHQGRRDYTAADFIVEQANTEEENMECIVSSVLEFAESRAKRRIPMTMDDCAKCINAYMAN